MANQDPLNPSQTPSGGGQSGQPLGQQPLPAVGQYGNFSNQGYTPTNFQQDPSQVTPSGNPSAPPAQAYSNPPQSYQPAAQAQAAAQAGQIMQQQGNQGMAGAPSPQNNLQMQQLAQQGQQMGQQAQSNQFSPQQTSALQSLFGGLNLPGMGGGGSFPGQGPGQFQGNPWGMRGQQQLSGQQPGQFGQRMAFPSRYQPLSTPGNTVTGQMS